MSLTRKKFLEPLEIQKLRSSFDLKERNSCLLALALESGARANELLSLTQSDLFPDTQSVLFKSLKGGRDREIPIRPELFTACQKHIPFNISYRRLEQIWRMRRPVIKKFHSLRHTFAITLYQKHKDIKLVQLALGHRSPIATAIYTDFVYSQDMMRKILE